MIKEQGRKALKGLFVPKQALTLVTCTVNQFLKAHIVKGQQKTQLQHFKGRQEDESARAQHKLLRPRKNEQPGL